jgi:hypothetical protein
MEKHNFNLQAITAVTSELESAGFINVRESVLKMPIGGWHDDPELKEIGEIFRLVMKEAIPEIGMRVIQENLGWSWQGKGELGSSIPDIFSVAHRYWPETGLINQPRGG